MKSFSQLITENTQVTVGDYTTRHFDMCPSAVKLYSKIKNMTVMVHLIVENMMLHDLFFRLEKQAVAQGAIDEDDLEKAQEYADLIMYNAKQMDLEKEHSYIDDVHMAKFNQLAGNQEDNGEDMNEKTLTPAELKKREEIAKAIKRENPSMPMAKKMAIATATAKKVAESVQDMASMGNRSLARIANRIGHPLSAAAKNEIARRRMHNEERVISGGYRDQDGKYHPPKTASSIAKDHLAKKAAIMKKTATAMRSEEIELDESITKMSDAKLKAHALNNVPHGSYSKSEISAEHNRRKKTGGTEYGAVKPSMNEATDMSKLKLLARAGLVDSKNVERLMAAFKVMQAGKPLSPQQKDLVISSYGELASIVTGDSQIFQKAKKAVAEAIVSGN